MNNQQTNTLSSPLALGIALFVGVILRLLLPWLGHNYDVTSWETVADIVREGKNVFAWTDRHNYGPGLFPIFGFAKTLSLVFPWNHPESFHFSIALILTLTDLGICWLLVKKVNPVAGILFFLSPISILITGFHSQVDNIAIFLGFASWLFYESNEKGSKKIIFSALLLGTSLIVKHNFIFLPLWLLCDPRWKNRSEKIIYLLITYTLFFGSFIPFCGSVDAQHRIVNNVFRYTMGSGNALLPHLTQAFFPIPLLYKFFGVDSVLKCFFILGMLLTGRFIMKREPENAFYLHLICLIVLSPQMADQYLVIPVLACAFFARNRWLIIYTVATTWFIIGSPFNLYLWPQLTGYSFLTSIYKGGFWWYYHCQIWLFIFLLARYLQPRLPKPC